MEVIDDEGYLFGVVNVVDALVVLGILAVVVAGIAFINPFAGGGEEVTRYATIEADQQPTYVAEQISTGDVMSPRGTPKNLTVTDVYRTPGQGENASVTMRVRVNGTLVERPNQPGMRFEYAGTELAPGTEFTVATGAYSVTGRITNLSDRTATLSTAETQVVLQGTVSSETADAIAAGDTYEFAGDTVATIKSIHVAPGSNQNTQRIVVGATVHALTQPDTTFADQPLTLGRTIHFRTDTYQFSSTIQATGTTTPPGTPATRTVVVQLESISPQLAENLNDGLTEQRRGTTTATVQDVRVEPAVIALTSESGNIYQRQHPIKKDAYLTVEVNVRETANGLTFHGQPLQESNTVVLDFRTITVTGDVINIQN